MAIDTDDGNGGTDGPETVNINITPFIVAAYFYDDGEDGIDEMVIELSDDVDESSVEASDFGLTGATLGVFSNFASGNIDNPLDLSATDQYVTFEVTTAANTTAITGFAATYTSSGGTDIASNNTGLSALSDGDLNEVDRAGPVILSVSIPNGNPYIRVVFSEEVANSDGNSAVDETDFAINNFTNNGTAGATGVSITSPDGVTDDSDALLTTGGWSVLRILLDITGVPDTDDQFQIGPSSGAALYDLSSNAMGASQLSAIATLDEVDLADVPQFEWAYPNTDNSIVFIKFTVPVDRNSSTSSFEVLRYDDNTSQDEINVISYNDNGSGATVNHFDNQNMNSVSGSDDEIWELDYGTGGNTAEGIETYTIRTRDNQIYNRDTGDEHDAAGRNLTGVLLADEFAEDFSDAVATAIDSDEDGNIDQVLIVMPDGVDDTTIEPGDFLLDTSVGQSFDTGTTPNDNTFTIGFTNYIGTEVTGDLDYQATRSGTLSMLDDAEYFTYEGIILGHTGTRGNVIVDGSLSLGAGAAGDLIDGAGPIITEVVTRDNDLNGQIDRLEITFSENIESTTLDITGTTSADFSDFDDDGTFDIEAVDDGMTDDATVVLTISESLGTFATPDLTFFNSEITDLQGASIGTDQTLSTSDGAAPFITLVTQTSTDQTPDLSGTVDDPTATVLITIDGNTRTAVNDGLGSWTLTNSNNPFTLTELTGYDVTTLGIDVSGNNQAVVVNNGYTLDGGAIITPAAPGTLCVSDGFATLGQISIAETATGDFGSSGSLLLTLPEGFEFDTSIPADFSNSSLMEIGVTSTYIGTASLRLDVTVSGIAASDIVRIDDLEVRATLDGASGNLERAGGDAGLLTNNTNYATLSSGTAPAAPNDVDDQDGNTITQYITNEFAIINVIYSLPSAAFAINETVTFTGGAEGVVISDDLVSILQVYLIDGALSEISGTVTGGTSGSNATVSSTSFSSELTRPFSFTVTTGGATPTWSDAATSTAINNNVTNTNSLLGATSPGLYSYDISLNGGSCDSESLRVNALIFNDLNDNYERTFIDKTFVESDSRDTIYLSNPANHTVSVSGTGVTITNPLSTRLLVLFDPEIAGSTNSPHTINYQITNDLTGESITQMVNFTVNPVTEFFNPVPNEDNCFSDLPLNLVLDNTQYGSVVSTDLQFRQFFFAEYNNGATFPLNSFVVTDADLGGSFPWATGFQLQSSSFTEQLAASELGDGSAIIIERWTNDPNSGSNIFDYDYLFFYGDPFVSISNVRENYCEDEPAFELTRNVRYVSSFTADNPDSDITTWSKNIAEISNQAISNGYILQRWNGASFVNYADFTAGGTLSNEFNPLDPDQDGNSTEDETGLYRIVYTTEQLTPANCEGIATIEINVQPAESTPTLTTTTLTDGSAVNFFTNSSPEEGDDPDEYVLEYCVGDVVNGFSAVDNNTYAFTEILTGIVFFAADPGFIPGETIDGLSSGAKAVSSVVTATSMDFTFIANSAFTPGETIRGQTSGASVTIDSFSEYVLTTESVQGLSSGATATITSIGTNGFIINPASLTGTFSYGEIVQGLSTGDRAQLVGAGEISWFDESLNEIRNFSFNGSTVNYRNRYTIIPAALGLNTTTSNRLTSEESAVFYFSASSIYGCESDLRKVTVNVFDIPDEPVLDASAFPASVLNISGGTPIYVFDYCVEDGGGSTVPDPLLLEDLLDDEAYNISREFRDFSAGTTTVANTVVTEIDGNTDLNQESIPVLSLSAGDSIIYTITKTENISIAPETTYSNFVGCTGEDIIVRIVAREEATSPTQLDFVANTTEFHICEGDALGNINHTFIDGTDEYTWYEDVDAMNNGISRIGDVLGVGDPMTPATLATATSNRFDANTPGIYTYYVSRNNDVTESRDFEGCESEAVAVSITVHEIQNAPRITSDNSPFDQVPANFPDIDDNPMDNIYEFAICSDQLFGSLNFVASDLFVADEAFETGDERVEWYNASTNNLLHTGEEPTFAELFLTGLDATVVTLEVIQVTDTLRDSFGNFFDGCPSPAATVIINVSDPAELTVVDASDAELSSSFCRDDLPTSFDARVRAGSTLVTADTLVDYEINSYLQSTYDANGTPEVDGLIVNDAFPVLDLIALHDGVPGTMAVGGEPSVHEVILFYTDPNSFCTGNVTKLITIYPDPHLSILVNDVDVTEANFISEFCYDAGDVSLEGVQYIYDNTGIIDTIGLNSGQFTSSETGTLGGNSGQGNFVPNQEHNAFHGVSGLDGKFLGQSNIGVTFDYTDEFNCDNSISVDLSVNPQPEFVGDDLDEDGLIAGIQIENSCESDSLRVFVEMVGDKDDYEFEWFVNGFSAGESESGAQNGDVFAYGLGDGEITANFRVEATYIGSDFATMCISSSEVETVTEGRLPIPKMSWVGLTAGHPEGTDFTIYQDENVPGSDIDTIRLTIEGIGIVLDSVNSTNPATSIQFPIEVPDVIFPSAGQYNATLRMTTSTGCDVFETRTINILPHINNLSSENAYREEFEGIDLSDPTDGWFSENRSLDGKEDDLFSSWRSDQNAPGSNRDGLGSSVYSNYNETTSGETSFIYSPSFDLTPVGAPTISFLKYEDFDTDKDGVVLQYTTDDGRTWEILGSFDAGLLDQGLASTPGWYNSEGIISVPGADTLTGEFAANSDAIGWAQQSVDQRWEDARAPIPAVSSNYIRFRFSLASQVLEQSQSTGFGFDDLSIFNRDQVVLLELFSSSFSENSVDFMDTTATNENFIGSDVLTINYFTDLENGGSETDPFNDRVSNEANAKTVYYGVDQVPSLGINGDVNFIEYVNDAVNLEVTRARLDNAKLSEPGFSISLTASEDNNLLSISSDFTALIPFSEEDEIGLFLAIVEPQITLAENIGELLSGTTVNNVLRRLLPNGAGKFISREIAIGEALEMDTTWAVTGLMNESSLRVIAFAQNLNTKIIYQAAAVEVPLSLENALGTDDQFSSVTIFPNPSDEAVTIDFGRRLDQSTNWFLFDQTGRQVFDGSADIGTQSLVIDTKTLPSGLYLIHLDGGNDQRLIKRVVVVH